MVVRASGLRQLVENQIHNDRSNGGDSLPTSIEADLVQLVEELQSVDVNNALAELNATTISDNNGGRILL